MLPVRSRLSSRPVLSNCFIKSSMRFACSSDLYYQGSVSAERWVAWAEVCWSFTDWKSYSLILCGLP